MYNGKRKILYLQTANSKKTTTYGCMEYTLSTPYKRAIELIDVY